MIELQNLTLRYQEETVLENLTLTIPDGGRAALMGPSGCGKTTLLRYLAGLIPASGGKAAGIPEKVAFVFQEPRLLPWRTAAENVNLVLGDKKSTLPTAAEWLDRVGLRNARDKYPSELSGGMRQRVNIVRALAAEGDLLLLDEPFQGLDEGRAEDVAALVRECAAGRTLLLATHDRREAEALGCAVWHFRDGRFTPEV